jgi:hypothetical protein
MSTSVSVRSFPEYAEGSPNEARSSGVSWSAVIAGAFVATALSLILLALGTGVGLSAGSLWANSAAAGTAIGFGAVVWLVLAESVAAAAGGYVAGRLRTKWVAIHGHEVYFRDTAHGLLVWAVAVVVTGAFLGTAAASMAGSRAAAAPSSATAESRALNPNDYFADRLFRSASLGVDRSDASYRDEANLILLNGVAKGSLSSQDNAYLDQLVAARTGLSPAASEARVSEVFTDDLAATEAARKAVAHSLYWLFVALLIGAYCASHAATIGGRQRDLVRRPA